MSVATASRGGRPAWIAGPAYDALFFIGVPALSLLVGYGMSLTSAQSTSYELFDQEVTLHALLLRTVIHAHLFITVFRSHGNQTIFRQHRLRFTLVPIACLVVAFFSPIGLVTLILVTTLWDLYHSSLQTFGIGRIYDAKSGADVSEGRKLDICAAHALYLAPFLVGPLMGPLLDYGNKFGALGLTWLDAPVAWLKDWQWAIGQIVVVACVVLAIIYGWRVYRRVKAGRPPSWQKLVLFLSTGVTCWLAWGLNSFGEALLIVNLFHAVQYFAIVWWTERDRMTRSFGLSELRSGARLALLAFLVIGLGYGFIAGATSTHWASSNQTAGRAMLAITNVVALMHFWYDGFIWSVRRRQV